MPGPDIAPSVAALLSAFSHCFTRPSFDSFSMLMTGWLSCPAKHTVTGVIRAAGAVGTKHHTSFHRFFRVAQWDPDDVGDVLRDMAVARVPKRRPLIVALDDTLARHTGKRIESASMHRDALLSTGAKPFFHFGHVWVVMTVVLTVARWNKTFALPIAMRLYRPEKLCKARDLSFHKKPQLAAQMIGSIAKALSGRRICAVADSDYANSAVMKTLPENVDFVGRARMDAALYCPPKKRQKGDMGRPRVKGERLPSPAARARAWQGWKTVSVDVYGRSVEVEMKTFQALWYKVAGGRLMSFVIVRGWPGHKKDDVLFCTDLSVSPEEVVRRYCLRWSIEVTFQEAKGRLGFQDPQNRCEKAVRRTAPMALWAYSITVLWYLAERPGVAALPALPWYRKDAPAFSDMLAAIRRDLWRYRLLDPPPGHRRDQKSVEHLIDAVAYAA